MGGLVVLIMNCIGVLMIDCQSIASRAIVYPVDEVLGWYERSALHCLAIGLRATSSESFYQEAHQALKMFIIDKTEEDFLI